MTKPTTLFFAVALLLPAGAGAQQTMSDVLSFLITSQAVQTGDAARDRAAAEATRDTLSRGILAALATLPLTSSSSGFTYRFNPELGTMERASESFGPFFLERAQTSGRGRAAFAVTYQYASFNQIDGMPLGDGTLVTTANKFQNDPQPFDVETLTLSIQASTVTFSGNVGLTNHLDVGVAVPFVSLSLAGARTDVYYGTRYEQATASGSVSEFGDLLVRAKYNLLNTNWGGLAAGVDVRLPTGSSADLLGAGQAGTHVFMVASAGSERVSTHVNGGIAAGGISSGYDFGTAIDVSPTPRFSVSGELVAHRLSDLGRITQVTAPNPSIAGVDTIRLVADTSGITTTFGAVGFKWNVASGWIVRANLLVPLNDAGLTSRAIPAFAVEYNFGR
jgi:hypothetical protein